MATFKLNFEKLHHYPWRQVLEHLGLLKGLLMKVPLVITGHLTVEVGLAVTHLAKAVRRLARRSGWLFVALYLKQCAVHLQRYHSVLDKSTLINSSASVSVSLTRCGLPRVIPKVHRHQISIRDDRSRYLVKLYLSLFSVCRIIKLAKKIDKSTFSSITSEHQDIGLVQEVLGIIKNASSYIIPKYLPFIREIPLNKGFSWVPTWKSLPNQNDSRFGYSNKVVNCFSSLKHEIASFAVDLNILHSTEGIFSPAMLFGKRVLYPLDNEYTRRALHEDAEFYESNLGIVFADLSHAYTSAHAPLVSGRLGQSLEGSGKRRIFAIGNYIKQRLLFPVHEWAMKILSKLPTDGTYEQVRPIRRLSRRVRDKCYSFDLKSATDRFPLSVIYTVFSCMFGSTMASCVVNGTLGYNSFYVGPPGFKVKKVNMVCFVTGQPLGYYGSWALFALTHHFMVWLAAESVLRLGRKCFLDYALLGDDIVIADERVANEYQSLMDRLGVAISKPKSLVSDCGCFEFAKQFWEGELDLSPVSCKALLVTRSTLGLFALRQRYNVSQIALARLGGAGYRVVSSLSNSNFTAYRKGKSRRWRRWVAVSHYYQLKDAGLSISWWLGRGKPLNPYLQGALISYLKTRIKPRQLSLPPCPEVLFEGEATQMEYTLYHNWVKMWLKWVHWYADLELDYYRPLDYYYEVPIISTRWSRSNFDADIARFGLLWQSYDWVEELDIPLPLPCDNSLRHGETQAFSAVYFPLPREILLHR